MRPCFFAACCLLLLATFCLADPPRPSGLRPDILYTTKGEFVQVSPMRALTLNAHVEQFQYDPLGLELAYVGSETQGDTTKYFVKTIDAHTGHELNHLMMTARQDDRNTRFQLLGWSMSGKYLLIQRFMPAPVATDTAISEYLRWDLSASPPTIHPIAPESALPTGMQPADGPGDGFASPDRHWIVFEQHFQGQNADGRPKFPETLYLLYDPEQNTFQTLTLPTGAVSTRIWSDNTHLDLWQGDIRKQMDVITGSVSPSITDLDTNASTVSRHFPDLALDVEDRLLEDTQASGGSLDSRILWIRRTPLGKMPLGAAAAGLMPHRRELEGPGSADPQAVWSPAGKQVAFIANNELYVTNLMASTDLLPHEKLAVGLKLSCAEERQLAMSNVQQIGLGIIQYVQDNDEKYPVSDGFTDKVYPYIKSMEMFQAGSHKFVYEQPKDLSLAKMEVPAETELGFIELPCARVVLFADGHVKSFPKAGNTGGGGE